jgi:saccharopine dehydrogenase-like NADP-dependent oxidoreductase
VELYGLQEVATMYRGTLRRPPFCEGWQALVALGFTANKEVDADTFKEQVSRALSSDDALANGPGE